MIWRWWDVILILSRYGETEFVDVSKAVSIKLVSKRVKTEVHIMFPGGKTLVLEYDKEFVGDIAYEETLFKQWLTKKGLYPVPGEFEASMWFGTSQRNINVDWRWE